MGCARQGLTAIALLRHCYADWALAQDDGQDATEWQDDWDDDALDDEFAKQLRAELERTSS